MGASQGHSSTNHQLPLLAKFQKADTSNFHAWNYRRLITTLKNVPDKEELEYTLNVTDILEDGQSYLQKLGERTPENHGVEDVPLPFLKRPIRDGLETPEELYASLEQFAKDRYPLEEQMLNWCALKNPRLIENPKVIEIREEDVKACPFLPYTSLPFFKKNDVFHEELKALAEKIVQEFNCWNVAAAPSCCYMLDIIVSKGDSDDGLRVLIGRVRYGVIEDVVDAGCAGCGCT